MLRIAIYATLIAILMPGAASAQTYNQGVPGYSNAVRTDLEKKNDREIDRAYQSTVKGRPDAEKSDPWADVRPAPPAAANNKNCATKNCPR
jgi:hypothetical protein